MNSSDILTDIKHQHDINKLSLNKIKNFGLFIETKCFSTVCKGSENQLTIK